MKSLMKWLLSLFLAVFILLAGAYYFAPWKPWFANQLKGKLEIAGIKPVSFEVDSIGLYGVVLRNVTALKPPIHFDKLEIGYSLQAILQGKTVLRISLVPLTYGPLTLSELLIDLKQGEVQNQWFGTWHAKDIAFAPIPSLQGEGTLAWEEGALRIGGNIISADKTYATDFTLEKPKDKIGEAIIKKVTAPWQGGTVSSSNIRIPLNLKSAVPLTLQLRNIPLGALLSAATGDKVEATGTLSGSIPVTVQSDGNFKIHNGKLTTNTPGIIKLSEGAIPGENPQLLLVKNILSNFNYETLSLTTTSDKTNVLSMLLSLSGHNPDAYNGREVKLNVRLTGDVIKLVQQSILPYNDPNKLLEQTQ